MAFSIFKAFKSTVTPPNYRDLSPTDNWLTDPQTGAIIGVEAPTGTGPDARFTPVDITAAQLAVPTAAMLADLDATYRLNVAPYPRYYSDGAQLAPFGASETEVVIPPGFNTIFYAPLTIATPEELLVQGQVRVIAYTP